MEIKDPSQNTATGISPVSFTSTTAYPDRDEIDRCVRKAEFERAAYIAGQGQKLWQTINSLWHRPRMIPRSYGTT